MAAKKKAKKTSPAPKPAEPRRMRTVAEVHEGHEEILRAFERSGKDVEKAVEQEQEVRAKWADDPENDDGKREIQKAADATATARVKAKELEGQRLASARAGREEIDFINAARQAAASALINAGQEPTDGQIDEVLDAVATKIGDGAPPESGDVVGITHLVAEAVKEGSDDDDGEKDDEPETPPPAGNPDPSSVPGSEPPDADAKGSAKTKMFKQFEGANPIDVNFGTPPDLGDSNSPPRLDGESDGKGGLVDVFTQVATDFTRESAERDGRRVAMGKGDSAGRDAVVMLKEGTPEYEEAASF